MANMEERKSSGDIEIKEGQSAKKKKMIIAIAAVIIVAVVACIVVVMVSIPNKKYNHAVALMNSGNYEEAIAGFEALEGYKDSVENINECNYNKTVALMNSGNYEEAIVGFAALDGYKDSAQLKCTIECNIISEASVGDVITYGDYNGNTEWVVLAKENEKILVISKYILEKNCYNYNEEDAPITWTYDLDFASMTWENCTLRNWLNTTYFTTAFSGDEQSKIIETSVVNSDNASCGTDGGNDTTDKIFLLSIDEVNKYFSSDSERQATFFDATSPWWWWLRSPGGSGEFAAKVNDSGSVNDAGLNINVGAGGVRPAMWIDISNQ